MNHEQKLLHLLQHTLGLDQYGQGKPFRNHFVTSLASTDGLLCAEHTEAGRMARRGPHELYGGEYCWYATPAGVEYVRAHSPKPPKLTRSQKRYLEFLEAEPGVPFGEWLKRKTSWFRARV